MKQTLIDKYFAGETSVKEENELKRLLQETPVKQLTSTEVAVLSLLEDEMNKDTEEDIFSVNYTEEFDRILAEKQNKVPEAIAEDTQEADIAIEIKPKIFLWRRATAIAASVAILFGSYLIWNNQSGSTDDRLAKVETPTKVTVKRPVSTKDESKLEAETHNGESTDNHSEVNTSACDSENIKQQENESEEVIDIYDLVAETDNDEDVNIDINLLNIDLAQASVQGGEIRSSLYAINNELFLEE